MIVISDTTPVLSLLKAGRLELLEKLYQNVIMPEAVYAELTNNADYEDERKEIESCLFLSVDQVHNMESVRILRNVTGLDAGEIREALEIMLTCDIRLSQKLCNKVLRYIGLETHL